MSAKALRIAEEQRDAAVGLVREVWIGKLNGHLVVKRTHLAPQRVERRSVGRARNPVRSALEAVSVPLPAYRRSARLVVSLEHVHIESALLRVDARRKPRDAGADNGYRPTTVRVLFVHDPTSRQRRPPPADVSAGRSVSGASICSVLVRRSDKNADATRVASAAYAFSRIAHRTGLRIAKSSGKAYSTRYRSGNPRCNGVGLHYALVTAAKSRLRSTPVSHRRRSS